MPSGSPKVAEARGVLEKFGIDINDARNGIFLPNTPRVSNPEGRTTHNVTMRRDYYSAIEEDFRNAESAEEVLGLLSQYKDDLRTGRWQ